MKFVLYSTFILLLFCGTAIANMYVPQQKIKDPYFLDIKKIVIWVSSPLEGENPKSERFPEKYLQILAESLVNDTQQKIGNDIKVFTISDSAIRLNEDLPQDVLVIHFSITKQYRKMNSEDLYTGALQITAHRADPENINDPKYAGFHRYQLNSDYPTIIQDNYKELFLKKIEVSSKQSLDNLIAKIQYVNIRH